jgi:hypothetical protein
LWASLYGGKGKNNGKATNRINPNNNHNMQMVLYLPFFADAAMPMWMMGAGWRKLDARCWIGDRISNIQYQVSSIQYPVSSIQHQASSIQYPVSSIQMVDTVDIVYRRKRKQP